MARTTEQIYTTLTGRYQAELAAVGVAIDPASWSKVNLLRLFFWVVAFCWKSIEESFDQLRAEILDTIARMKPHSPRWYALKAREFQYGDDLVAESDYYDNTGLTQIDIDNRRIVKYSAVNEQLISPIREGLRIKVATIENDDLAKLTAPQLAAVTEYMSRVKDAGVGLLITSDDPDSLQLSLKVYYNPLVLNSQGQRIDGTNTTPVQKAISDYLKNLPFNGVFVLAFLVDALQKVDGVVIPHVVNAKSRYGALPYTNIDVKTTPDAGYLRILDPVADLTIQWIPQSVIQ